jgi:hypothetical protein
MSDAGKPVSVTFLDADSGGEIAWSELPPAALPQRFTPRLAFELGGVMYEVVSALPATREEAMKVGVVRVYVRSLAGSPVDPRSIVFSMPTLADDLPPLEEGAVREGRRLLELHEDDWRQIEFFSAGAEPRVSETLHHVRKVLDEERTESGAFERLHVRTGLGPPLQGVRLPLSDVHGTLRGATPLDGIAILGAPGLVKDGFAFDGGAAFELYGVAPRGEVEVLALRPSMIPDADLAADAHALAMLMLRRGLKLVDWCGARVANADPREVQAIVGR